MTAQINMADLSDDQQRILRRLQNDNQFYNRKCLKIKTDDGIVPMVDNQVQDYIEYRAEDQLRRTGKVRMVGVKARQQGFSEKVASRGFKFATQNCGKTVYILSHESMSTATLYAKVERYYRYCPEFMKPGLRAANRNQMKFDNESEYSVGTAGSENTGRSNTIQFAHISEPAHFDKDDDIKAGLLQCISDAEGTEIWWESTARGKNWFYRFVQKILAGETEYEVIFVPWFWTDKYSLPAPANFKRTEEEETLAQTGTCFDSIAKEIVLRPLSDDQLFWRRQKIAVLGERLFKQEYPAFLEEAFQSSEESFHDSALVNAARACDVKAESISPLILGVDPARTGDRTVLTLRQGREVHKIIKYTNMDTMRLAGIVADLIDREGIDKVFIDWGMGHGTIDRLHDRGYKMVEGVNFGGVADDPLYLNKRAEMGHLFDQWLKEQPCNLPDDDDMASDIASIPSPQINSSGKLKFPSKDDIRKDSGRSPDIWDSIVLTFAYPVKGRSDISDRVFGQTGKVEVISELTTQQRRRELSEVKEYGGIAGGSSGRLGRLRA